MMAVNGKLKIYSSNAPRLDRLRIVDTAVSNVAGSLNFELEHSNRKELLSIYVYYEGASGDEIPLYCDWGKQLGADEVSRSIRSMMFVLSFHPKHSNLRGIRTSMVHSA
ncbi:MAG: hypothetical protein JSV35_06005 [Candidatus Bathyarchaeota archaeon]|nr:MAG: hypothetical protein JSV35_06005 [Candidatus Bathyarchaeota archaeon]